MPREICRIDRSMNGVLDYSSYGNVKIKNASITKSTEEIFAAEGFGSIYGVTIITLSATIIDKRFGAGGMYFSRTFSEDEVVIDIAGDQTILSWRNECQ